MTRTVPHLIALCGNPGSGKSTAQKLLLQLYGHEPVDDGFAVRDIAMRHLGLSHDDVYTQEGKARSSEILGKTWQHRVILGEVANRLEEMFGDHIMPWIHTRKLDPAKRYSFGSVRRDQGLFYKQIGGVVIGIRNPLAPPSPNEFDRFDETVIDHWIDNDGLARGLEPEQALLDLADKLIAIVGDAA